MTDNKLTLQAIAAKQDAFGVAGAIVNEFCDACRIAAADHKPIPESALVELEYQAKRLLYVANRVRMAQLAMPPLMSDHNTTELQG